MTYLELVNNVLRRLREREVPTVTANTYSKLIAVLVNDAKREVGRMAVVSCTGYAYGYHRSRYIQLHPDRQWQQTHHVTGNQ